MIHIYELIVINKKTDRIDLGIVYLGEPNIIFIPHNPTHPIVKVINKFNQRKELIKSDRGETRDKHMTESQKEIYVPLNEIDVNILNENLGKDYLAEDVPLTKKREKEIMKDVFDDGLWFKLVFGGHKALIRANRAFWKLNLEEFGRFFGARIGGFDSVTVSSPDAVLKKEGVVMPDDASAIILVDNRIIINGKKRSREKRGFRDIGVMSALGIKIWRLLPPDLKLPFKSLKIDKELSEEDAFGYHFAVWYAFDNPTGEKGIGYAKAFRRLFWDILATKEKQK